MRELCNTPKPSPFVKFKAADDSTPITHRKSVREALLI